MQRPPPVVRRLDDRVDAEHKRSGDEHRAGDVRPLAEPATALGRKEAHGERRGGNSDG